MSETKQNEENGRGEVTKKEVYRGIEIYTRSTFDGKDTIFFISDKYGNTPVTRSISEIKKIIDEIKGAIKYAEGRGLRIEVKSQKDVDLIKKLIMIKIKS